MEKDTGKPIIQSTQNWMNIVALGLSFIPTVKEVIAQNPELVVSALTLVNIIWRTFITKKPVTSFA